MTVLKIKCNSSIWCRNSGRKSFVLIVIGVIIIYLYYSLIVVEFHSYNQIEGTDVTTSYITENQKYLINTSKCRIPDLDPFNKEVKKYVVKEEYLRCTKLNLLTYIDKNDGVPTLKINTSLLPLYSSFKITCCYSKIFRTNYINTSDNDIIYSPCEEFAESVVLTHPFVKVVCSNFIENVYANVHATTIPSKQQRASSDRHNRFSVLLVGIDSISKLNLRRAMPKTYKYLRENLIDLKGYNKIGDNTFPNLMAILTGQNKTQLQESCSVKVKMNNCDIIWDTFRSLGYVTAYAEDECNIGTFNYDRLGFLDPPTNYYYRPYIVAAEKLSKKLRHGMTFCAGPETSGERILNIAKDFSVSFTNVPIFGLFWMNSFSHDDINLPSSMDNAVVQFLSDDRLRSSLSNTIMVFFSDHGFRFGDIRYTVTGWLEERLPFIYLHIPNNFKRQFPDKYRNFLVNTQRLTTPYDIYSTFQDILEMGNKTYKSKSSLGCPNCHSLFKEVDELRTCKKAAIDQHWCTCTGHNYINPKDSLVRLAAEFVIDEINGFVKTFAEGNYCSTYVLRKVVTAGMSEAYLNEKNETVYYFLLIVESTPAAMFEATVEAYLRLEHNDFKLLGDISRINRYAENSHCVKSGMLKKYCYCDGIIDVIKSAVCSIISC